MNSPAFINDIINGMYDWVRVLDREDNIIYVNKAMEDGLKGSPLGEKCYKVMGREAPCENCIARKSVFEGKPHEKEEMIGDRVFSVMSSPVKNSEGKVIAVVEVMRDTTQIKLLQKRIIDQNRKLQEELGIARKLQNSLLPEQIRDGRVDLTFLYKPCEALGGDFIDAFKIDENHIGLYIADVSGHGVPASMLTVFLRTSMNKKTLSPAQALRELFGDFNNMRFGTDLYITVFYAILDLDAKRLTYSNAGHHVLPFIYSREGFELLKVPGIPISNWLKEPVYTDCHACLKRGDRLFMYTDGITELRNGGNEQFGEERLLNILQNNAADPSNMLDRLFDEACSFAGIKSPADIPDDITMALLEIK